MTASEELRSYLRRLQRRLRLGAVLRGCAIVAAAALGATLMLVLIANRYAFSAVSMLGARTALLAVLALGAAFGLAVPLWRLTRARTVRRAEQALPQFQERLRTFAERDAEGRRDPFMELLAADTLGVARRTPPGSLAPAAALAALLGVGIACVGTLVWLIRAGPGYMGYGAALLWSMPRGGRLYDIHVTPGDATIRRHADLVVTAATVGLTTQDVRLHVRIGNADWQRAAMQPQPQAAGFRYLLSGLPDDAEYYVEAGPVESAHYHVHVADIPQVRQIRVTYHYPAWTNLPDKTDEHGGDLRAVQGTQAALEIFTDQPLTQGALVLDDGRQLPLTAGTGNVYRALVPLEKDGAYHLTTRERAQPTRISEDYFIEAAEAKAPQVAIVKPVNEYRASPIEEVTIAAQAGDDFGLKQFSLRYSVNGGPEQSVNLLPHSGVQQAQGSTTISLENLKLVPGDVISVYAQARDARAESRSDIVFVEAEPFEREFSQSQQGGGGGGAADDQAQISQREKEIIAGTWNQVDARTSTLRQAEQAKFLSDVQSTLRGQSLSLSGRLQMRDMTEANEQFSGFQKEMTAAAEAMGPAAEKLQQQQWRAAVPEEQKALQHLLRAEATFRQIQVAFGSAGGGGGGGSMGRDLASLSDLELDTQENQYETAQSATPEQKHDAQIDEALRKLDELARQQEQLAQAHAAGQDAAEQRWNQEMLRRNAQELQRQLEQLARGNQSSQGAQGAQGAQGEQGGQPGQGSEQDSGARAGAASQQGQGLSAADSAAVQQALTQLRAAQDAMRRAVDQRDPAGARRAAEQLRDAMGALGTVQQNESAGHLDELARNAAQLAAEARAQQQQLRDMLDAPTAPGRSGAPVPDAQSMIDARQKLADEVGRLTQQLRDAERETLKANRAAAGKLRDALAALDDADVQTRLQRSADRLRQGENPAGDSSEEDIAGDLAQLGERVRQAQAAAANGASPDDAALDGMQQFRARLAQLDPNRDASRDGASGERGQRDQSGARSGAEAGQSGQNGRGAENGQGGQGDRGNSGAQGSGTQGGEGRSPQALARDGGNPAGGGQGAAEGRNGGLTAGRVTAGGGGATGYINGGWNTGNNTYAPRGAAPPDTAPTPADRERTFEQGMADLNGVRHALGDDPEARREVDALIQSMQKLDPRRFPGNPQVVDELFAQVRSGVDRLELQLGHQPDDQDKDAVRSADTLPVPEGYQNAVADYFRRLSKAQ